MISVVIISWNAQAHLRRCLASIAEHASDIVLETIVVDNGSHDGSPEMIEAEFPRVELVRASVNLGFARANNIGFARAKGEYIAMMNSDVVLHAGCMQELARHLRAHPRACLVAPRIQGRNGELQRTCKRLPTVWNTFCRFAALDRLLPGSRRFCGFELPATDHAAARSVPAIGGCFWLLRSSAIREVGAFDERYFFYAEDIDWCKRFGEAGWSIDFLPTASATHYGGGSTEGAPVRYSIEIIRSTLQYWRKHHGRAGASVCFSMFVTHHAIRLLPRLCLWALSGGRAGGVGSKIAQDYSCLRWLLTGAAASGAGQ